MFGSQTTLRSLGTALAATVVLVVSCSSSGTAANDDSALDPVHLSALSTPHADLRDLVDDSSLVIVGSVSGEGPSTISDGGGEDVFEIVALNIKVEEILVSASADIGEVVIPWEAYMLGEDRQRTNAVILDGIRPPEVGASYVFFLEELTADEKRAFGASTTHELVGLDGIYVVRGDSLVSDSLSRSPAVSAVDTMTLAALRDELSTKQPGG